MGPNRRLQEPGAAELDLVWHVQDRTQTATRRREPPSTSMACSPDLETDLTLPASTTSRSRRRDRQRNGGRHTADREDDSSLEQLRRSDNHRTEVEDRASATATTAAATGTSRPTAATIDRLRSADQSSAAASTDREQCVDAKRFDRTKYGEQPEPGERPAVSVREHHTAIGKRPTEPTELPTVFDLSATDRLTADRFASFEFADHAKSFARSNRASQSDRQFDPIESAEQRRHAIGQSGHLGA